MKQIDLAYGTGTVWVSLPEKNLHAILEIPKSLTRLQDTETSIVQAALNNPIGTSKLHELSIGKQKIVIITSDHTRAVPSKVTMPLLLHEIRSGNPKAEVIILIATGLHRRMTEKEMIQRFGSEIYEHETIINHDAFDQTSFINLGILPSGNECEINRIAAECDLLIAEGFIEPHFFAGFSGGRKSILPGIASQRCININHSASAIDHPLSSTGILDGNIIHEDMVAAARMANLAFILNVLLDRDKKVIEAYCGDADKAHRAGAESLINRCGVTSVPSDIVITTNGGYPLDQNLYQCPKGLDAALSCAKENAVIILAASCSDGLGGENFSKMMLSAPPEVLNRRILQTPPEETISEQWCVQRFSRALLKHSIILVTDGLDRSTVEHMHFIYASSIDDAVETAFAIKGKDASVTVIPDGVGVIVRR